MSTPETATEPPRPAGSDELLSVRDLRVSFATEDGLVTAVDGVSFDLAAGEVLAVVGESGSGKSVTAMTLMGLTRSPNSEFEGTAHYKGTELIGASEDQLRRVRGAEIAMIFQDPMTSLNPVLKIGGRSPSRSRSTRRCPTNRRASGRSSCSTRSGSRAPATGSTPIRTSSRAACASA